MSEEKDKAVQEFMEEIAEDLGYSPKREKRAIHGRLTEFGWVKKSVIFAGAGVILLILIIVGFSTMGSKISRDDLAPMQGELEEIKERIIALEGVERRLSLLEKQTEKSIQTAAVSGPTIENRKGNRAGGKIYHTVRKGDTLSGIGKKYGISAQRLCQLNGMNMKQTLSLGQKLLVKK